MSVFNGYLTDAKPSDKVTLWASTRGLGDSEGGYVSKEDLVLYCPRGLTACFCGQSCPCPCSMFVSRRVFGCHVLVFRVVLHVAQAEIRSKKIPPG